jgi:predicted nucleic acid-binding protein
VIVADTGAILALIDADDRWHGAMRDLFEADPSRWLLPWAVLPEVDYLLAEHVGTKAQEDFHDDLANGAFAIYWGERADIVRARELHKKYRSLRLGLVDGVVAAVAERVGAKAIATLDVRHFGAMALRGRPILLPRDA